MSPAEKDLIAEALSRGGKLGPSLAETMAGSGATASAPAPEKRQIPPAGEATRDMMLILPWPPTLNNLFATAGNRRVLSKRGKAYRAEVARRAAICPRHVVGRIEVSIYAYPPDKRVRDLDNLQKSILDSLKHAGVIEDDGKIDRLSIVRREVMPKAGHVNVFIVGATP